MKKKKRQRVDWLSSRDKIDCRCRRQSFFDAARQRFALRTSHRSFHQKKRKFGERAIIHFHLQQVTNHHQIRAKRGLFYTTEVIVEKSCREAGLFSSETRAARIEHVIANTRASSGFRPLLKQKCVIATLRAASSREGTQLR